MTETQSNMIQLQRQRDRDRDREREREKERERERKRVYYPTVYILRLPSIKIPNFFAQHRPERDRHSI